jgi:flagellar hook-associated protein 2
MAGMSLDGLVSGLDTSNLVRQLMQLERLPQSRLQTKLTQANSLVNTYQTLNTRVLAIKSTGEALMKPDGLQATKATSSVPGSATVTASPAAAAGSLTFSVTALASAHTTISKGSVAGQDAVAATGDLTLTVGGVEHAISLGDKESVSLDELVTLINKAGAGVQATAVQVEPGIFKLQLASMASGAAGTFSLTAADAEVPDALASLGGGADAGTEFATVSTGRDARIWVGDADGGYEVRRPTNVMTDVLPGVTINLLKADTDPSNPTKVRVDITTDTDAVTAKVNALVEGVNGVFANIKLNGTFNAETKSAGPLVGNATARQVQTALYQAIGTLGQGESLSEVGLSVTRDGMLSIDKEAFAKAFAADPAKVTAFFTGDDGYASKLVAIARSATDPSDPAKGSKGTLTAAIDGRKDAAKGLTDQIASWDTRLTKREASLKRQYASLEGALGTLRNQSSWLAGSLAGLPSYNNSR